MQTFLPYKSFTRSAKCLDYRRLGKQRVECYQILQSLLGETTTKGWKNHPAVKQWKGYENILVCYTLNICDEWTSRGYKDTVKNKVINLAIKYKLNERKAIIPPWLGNEKYHSSHRSNLLRKDSQFYSQYGWSEPSTLEYYWPSDYFPH